jgi:hypothetical protein
MQQSFLPVRSSRSSSEPPDSSNEVHYDSQDSYVSAQWTDESDDSDYYVDHVCHPTVFLDLLDNRPCFCIQDDQAGGSSVCSLLQRDIQSFRQTFGAYALNYRSSLRFMISQLTLY